MRRFYGPQLKQMMREPKLSIIILVEPDLREIQLMDKFRIPDTSTFRYKA